MNSSKSASLKTRRGRQAYSHGKWAEFAASCFLQIKGYKILEKRFKTKVGELDIIAEKKKIIIAVEVKYRPTYEAACESISSAQQCRIEKALQFYIQKHPKFQQYDQRFDALFLSPWRQPKHLVNAWWPIL